jgi:hypothetical protein
MYIETLLNRPSAPFIAQILSTAPSFKDVAPRSADLCLAKRSASGSSFLLYRAADFALPLAALQAA